MQFGASDFIGVGYSDQIEAERLEKRRNRGGFDKGLMLIKTSTPHSIRKQSAELHEPKLNLFARKSSEPVISLEADIPRKPMYRRSDLRQVDGQPEKMFTFEAEANRMSEQPGEVKE